MLREYSADLPHGPSGDPCGPGGVPKTRIPYFSFIQPQFSGPALNTSPRPAPAPIHCLRPRLQTRISHTDPQARPKGRRIRTGLRPHAPTLQRALAPQLPRRDEKRRSGPTVNVEAVCDLTRDVPESLHSFQSSNSLWFADFIQKFELVVVCGSASTPASSCSSKEAPRQGLGSERTIFALKWSPKASTELPGCLRETSADLRLARPETRAAPGKSSARGPLTFLLFYHEATIS